VSMQQVEFVLEGLRGATRGFTGIGLAFLLEVFVGIQPTLLKLLHLQDKSARMIYLILKLTAEVIESLIGDLNATNFPGIMNFVYEILRVYKGQNMGQVSLQKSKALKDEEEEEKYKNIRALLKLLSAITEKDMVDFGDGGAQQVDVATATFIGLEMVVPLLSTQLLSFPKLSQQYFNLIGHMCEVYPERVCHLPKDLFRMFVETLKFGVECDEFQNAGSSLEAIYHVVKAHLQDVSRGGQGLGLNGFMVKYFMEIIFHRTIFGNFHDTAFIEQASSALLVLMIAENTTFQEIGISIINTQVQEERRAVLQATLNQLASSVTAHANLTRQSRRKFSSEFGRLVVDIRGIANVM